MKLIKSYMWLVLIALIACTSEAQRNQAENREDSLITPAIEELPENTIAQRIQPPLNYKRLDVESNSFAAFLQNFPVLPLGEPVKLYNGQSKYRQDIHACILDIDIGNRDLQQCADAIMRLRAEYLLKTDQWEEISFNFTNGFPANYQKWRAGYRIKVQGNDVSWYKNHQVDTTYQTFKEYMQMVFSYAGTYSLSKELKPKPFSDIQIGDIFIQGGFPGHAVVVVDMAENTQTGDKVILLAQSYMPAQSIHVVKNFVNSELSPWYSIAEIQDLLKTPEWTFSSSDLKSF